MSETITKRFLPELTLRKGERFYHCAADGRWFASPFDLTSHGTIIGLEPMKDGPDLRALIGYGVGYECLGYFETVQDMTGRVLGTRPAQYPAGVGFGSYSATEFTHHRPFELTAGHRKVTIKASSRLPVKVLTTTNVLCGRLTRSIPEGFSK